MRSGGRVSVRRGVDGMCVCVAWCGVGVGGIGMLFVVVVGSVGVVWERCVVLRCGLVRKKDAPKRDRTTDLSLTKRVLYH